jgi:hypothetical protein
MSGFSSVMKMYGCCGRAHSNVLKGARYMLVIQTVLVLLYFTKQCGAVASCSTRLHVHIIAHVQWLQLSMASRVDLYA